MVDSKKFINIEAGRRLIDILMNVEDDHFNFSYFYGGFVGGNPTLEKLENKCGTTACALGYAALDPWFIERGLIINRNINTADSEKIFNMSKSNFSGIFFGLFGCYDNGLEYVASEDVTVIMVIEKLKILIDKENDRTKS